MTHLFQEFQNSLGERRRRYKEVPQNRRLSDQGRDHGIVLRARKLRGFPLAKIESLREILRELLSEDDCAKWLGYTDLTDLNYLPAHPFAPLIREPGWTDAENIHKLRMYRAAAFIDCLRPNVLDWETPHIPDMEWVLECIEVFTRPGISVEEQTVLIEDLSRPRVPLEKLVQTTRGPRVELSASDLRYVWDTKDFSHEERAAAWDNRTPKPFQPFGRPNLEMYGDKKLRDAWRAGVNRQLDKAKALYDPDSNRDERELD